MASSTESYAHCLRVIGQALETLRINAFTLEKEGGAFVVRDWEPSFLKGVADEIQAEDDFNPNQKSRNILIYTHSDAERLETLGRSKRGSNENPDAMMVALGLRLVGDYLDQKKAVTFEIQWSIESARVKFEASSSGPKETSFTMQNLKDLAVVMYLRRSRR
jgi:hypothetical protein